MKERSHPSIDRFSGTFLLNVPPWPQLISSCLISWFHISVLAVDIPTLVNNLLINAWAYRLLLSRLHHGLSHAFLIIALISITEWTVVVIDCHHMRLFWSQLHCVHLLYSNGLKLYFDKPLSDTLICVSGLIKREESKCYGHPGHVITYTTDQTKTLKGTIELFEDWTCW